MTLYVKITSFSPNTRHLGAKNGAKMSENYKGMQTKLPRELLPSKMDHNIVAVEVLNNTNTQLFPNKC